jgi:hypothetical protein
MRVGEAAAADCERSASGQIVEVGAPTVGWLVGEAFAEVA